MPRHRAIKIVCALALAVAVTVPFLPAAASPVCSDEPRTACGGRIFPEAENSVSFIQHDNGEYEAGIKALERDYPRYVKVRKLGSYVGLKGESAGGRPIWVIEVTDFQAPERGKKPVVVSMSAHGPERAGQEGGPRYVEDLARWATESPPASCATEPRETPSAFPLRTRCARSISTSRTSTPMGGRRVTRRTVGGSCGATPTAKT